MDNNDTQFLKLNGFRNVEYDSNMEPLYVNDVTTEFIFNNVNLHIAAIDHDINNGVSYSNVSNIKFSKETMDNDNRDKSYESLVMIINDTTVYLINNKYIKMFIIQNAILIEFYNYVIVDDSEYPCLNFTTSIISSNLSPNPIDFDIKNITPRYINILEVQLSKNVPMSKVNYTIDNFINNGDTIYDIIGNFKTRSPFGSVNVNDITSLNGNDLYTITNIDPIKSVITLHPLTYKTDDFELKYLEFLTRVLGVIDHTTKYVILMNNKCIIDGKVDINPYYLKLFNIMSNIKNTEKFQDMVKDLNDDGYARQLLEKGYTFYVVNTSMFFGINKELMSILDDYDHFINSLIDDDTDSD